MDSQVFFLIYQKNYLCFTSMSLHEELRVSPQIRALLCFLQSDHTSLFSFVSSKINKGHTPRPCLRLSPAPLRFPDPIKPRNQSMSIEQFSITVKLRKKAEDINTHQNSLREDIKVLHIYIILALAVANTLFP